MIDLKSKFSEFEPKSLNEQRLLEVVSCVRIYYGLTIDGNLRLSFITSIKPLEFESSKEIKVTQGKESDEVYWTCFDLLNHEDKDVFYIFCASLIDSIENADDQYEAINRLRDRFYSWRILLKNKGKISYESYQGLFGELYLLHECLINDLGVENAINCWVGPDGYSKDFSVNNTWYEIKTIGTSTSAIKINSLAQLESDVPGHLIINVVEKMSPEFNEGLCNVSKIYNSILDKIPSYQLKEIFKNKVLKYGYNDEEDIKWKFEIKKSTSFKVAGDFPRLTSDTLKTNAIHNVTYEIMLNAIDAFKEED